MKRAEAAADVPVTVELGIRLSNGHFETTIAVPVGAPSEIANQAVTSWLALAEALLKLRQATPE